jgi:chromosome segregation ATPase
MTQKIATVSTVFAACDRLDAANERWNREDVRNEVGGGGYVVIDPLIKAWRTLKPLREVAPTTPAELLHQVATTLESHITGFIEETESRQAESQQVFDTTVADLAEQLAALENELEQKEERLQAMAETQSSLTVELEGNQKSLGDLQSANAQLISENDGYRGQIARLEGGHKETVAKLNADAKESAKVYAAERSRVSKEHALALTAQRKELAEAAEQTENRLMMLLDQERQAAKESSTQLIEQLSEETEKAQTHREKTIELEATIRELNGQNGKLASNYEEAEARCSELTTALEDQQSRASSLQREFEAYKEQYKISGDLEALQSAVAAMQAQLDERKDE